MNILLDYFFPITSIEPTPEASTAFLKQVCVVASPKDGGVTAGVLTLCTTMTAVAALVGTSAQAEVQQLFNAGMNRVYILPMDDLDLADALEGHESDFFTVLISSDFDKDDVNATASTGNVTITSYANLLTTTPDTVTIDGTVFTAQSGAATLGTATFQAATSNAATAASLIAQINAHAVTSTKVLASAGATGVVVITALESGPSGNALTLAYADLGSATVGATVSGATLTGGDGLFLGAFVGVTGVSSTDDSFLATQAAISNRSAFHTTSGNKAKNMFFAFGKMLSNASDWLNQQYIQMPVADDVSTLGDCENLFDDKINFVMSDSEFGNRLGLFAAGGQAIVAPYIKRNLQIDMQSAALSYVSGNMPAYTKVQAALIQDELEKVIQSYIDRQWIEQGIVSVTLVEDNFVANSDINISEPNALWRIFGQMKQTL
jgi:hypothetical protein